MHCYIIIRKEERKKEKPACALLYNYKKGRKEERETRRTALRYQFRHFVYVVTVDSVI